MPGLYASASMRCISPDESLLEEINKGPRYNYEGIGHDLYLRLILLTDLKERFLILQSDNSTFPVTDELLETLKDKYGIDEKDILFGGTRSHNTCSGRSGPTYEGSPGWIRGYIKSVHTKVYEALDEALTKLQPAKIGSRTGVSGINVSREFPSPVGTIESQNHSYPAANTLRVFRVADMNDETIAVLVNYSMHCCLLCWNEFAGDYKYISGDVAGAVSRYVERAGKNTFPVLWTVGGGTDRQPVIYSRLERCAVDDNGEFHLEREILPAEGSLMLLRSYAAEQGLDILRTMKEIENYSDEFNYVSAVCTDDVPSRVNFENQIRMQMPDNDRELRYVESMDVTPVPGEEPVHLRYSLIELNGIIFAGVNASPYAENYLRLREEVFNGRDVFLFDDCQGSVTTIPTEEKETNHIYGHSTLQNKCLSAKLATESFIRSFTKLKEELEG